VFSEERNASVMRAFDDRNMHELDWLVDWAAKSDVEEEDEEVEMPTTYITCDEGVKNWLAEC
jgi:hypothetical protein